MTEINIPLSKLVIAIAKTVDLVSQKVANHHKRVAYIACELAAEMGLQEAQRIDIVQAGALHDVGSLSLKDKLDLLAFEARNTGAHQAAGYLLLRTLKQFRRIAEIVRYHHVRWDDDSHGAVPVESRILHLSDRVAVLFSENPDMLAEVPDIQKKIKKSSGTFFMPEIVEAFMDLSSKESFWLGSVTSLDSYLIDKTDRRNDVLNFEGLLEFAKLVSRLIDFRSRFTALHSSGVAASSSALAGFAGFSEEDCGTMQIAGYLHDLGKLAVPSEIIDKSRTLDFAEYGNMRRHTFYTHSVLQEIKGFGKITDWASLHHEKLDGSGYPFHLSKDSIPMGSRIMAVADVFTALTEDRPYRNGMKNRDALNILYDMSSRNALDRDVVSLADAHFDDMNEIRLDGQSRASAEYDDFNNDLRNMLGMAEPPSHLH